MKLTIPFSEAILIAKDKSGREITLAFVNEKTIKVGYTLKFKVSFTKKYIYKERSFDLIYEKFVDEDLYLAYNGGSSLDLIIELRKLIPQLDDTELFELGDGNRLVVHIGKTEMIHKVLQKVTIDDVVFTDDSINLLLRLKKT